MARMFRNDGSEKIAAIHGLLAHRGLDTRDFDIEEDSRSGIGQLLGLVGGILTLRRRSTGEIRVYASGAGSAWYASIAADLDRGYFRAPTPRASFARRAPQAMALWL